jgi:hypothetical protein
MSFILDALRKSETDRQQKGSAEFTGVPTSNSREKPPRWLWGLGLLLAINVVVLLGLLLRPDAQPAVATTAPPAQAIEAAPVAKDEFASQVAAARENAPPREERCRERCRKYRRLLWRAPPRQLSVRIPCQPSTS